MSPAYRVEGASRRRETGIPVACLVLLGLTLGALGHVAVQAKRLEVGLELGREQKRHHELIEQQRTLTLELGRLKDPGRLVTMARDKLQMAPPAASDIRPLPAAEGPR